ncbi:hypothetical protein [Hymenobacter siberiensis]|uniref:hypothetical protein n=1 Tax=Hymenobacter siberiensis TaxID=2848396 RepID=UPI001C1E77B1|nr:hypothetical protein [Hymenobacter siberiensis]
MNVSGITKLLPLLLLLLAGCFWGDEYRTRHLVGHYYLDEVEPNSGAWYLHFEDEKSGLADALINCQVVEAGYNERCIIMRAVCTNPQFYLLPITATQDREVARHGIRGPFTKQQFDTELKRICGDDSLRFDDNLTKKSL